MSTQLLAKLIIVLVTNVSNVVVELPMGPTGGGSERYVTTNIFERSTISWVWAGQTNSAEVNKLVYTATQVMRLRQTWEPGELRIHQPR